MRLFQADITCPQVTTSTRTWTFRNFIPNLVLNNFFSDHAGLWATDQATYQALDSSKAPLQGTKHSFRTIQPKVLPRASGCKQPWSSRSWERHKPPPPVKPSPAPHEPITVSPPLLAQVWRRLHATCVWRPRLRPLRPWLANWEQRAATCKKRELKPAQQEGEIQKAFVN